MVITLTMCQTPVQQGVGKVRFARLTKQEEGHNVVENPKPIQRAYKIPWEVFQIQQTKYDEMSNTTL